MNNPSGEEKTSPPSKRFTPSRWAARLVPAVLALLALGLLAVLVIIGLAIAGLL